MRRIRVVAINTAKEIIRDRILYGLLIFAVGLVFAAILLGGLSFAEQGKIITDLGLAAVELGCGGLAVFIGSSLVFREIDKQTILILLSKPVTRREFIIGKCLGLLAVLVIVNLLIAGILAGICLAFGNVHPSQFAVAQLGILLESSFLLCAAIFFGIFSRPIMTAIFTLCIWLIGHGVSDIQYFSQKSGSEFMKIAGSILGRILPHLDRFSFAEAAVYGDPISKAQFTSNLGLWAAWCLLLLTAALLLFERRDFT